VALASAREAIPQYSSRFSRHDYTQHQLYALVALRRLLRTDYRGLEATLRDWTELREALGLSRVPDHSTIQRAERRLNAKSKRKSKDRPTRTRKQPMPLSTGTNRPRHPPRSPGTRPDRPDRHDLSMIDWTARLTTGPSAFEGRPRRPVTARFRLQDLDRVGRHPDVDLPESRLQPFLECEKELAMLGLVRDIHKDADQVIAVRLAFVPPQAADGLRLGRDGPDPLLQFEEGVGHEVVWHGLTVIEPEREQDLVAPE
jgi:hypothetical protein